MNKILALAILVGTSITSSFSQGPDIMRLYNVENSTTYAILNFDTVAFVKSVTKTSWEPNSTIISSEVSVSVSLYRTIDKWEKNQIESFISERYKPAKGGKISISYERNYKNAGDYLIESGKLKHKAILTSIAGTFSGSIIMAIGAVTLNPILIYTGGAIISGSGISSLIMEIRSNNLLIQSGKKMVSNSK